MEKYYTPEIEEFHVGFEYEVMLWKNRGVIMDFKEKTVTPIEGSESESWIKKVVNDDDYGREDNPFDGFSYRIQEQKCRVKYLDREDIESLGFFCHATDERVFHSEKGIIINIGWGSPVKKGITLAIVSPVFDESKMSIVHENYLFNGTIKNKSELKKLLKQLGI